MWQELRYALRGLAKSPSFTAIAVLSLALGIGANSAIFSVLHAVLLNPLPYKNPDRLVALHEFVASDPSTLEKVSPANYGDWKARARSFESMGFYIDGYANASNVTGIGEPERLRTISVSTGFFSLLGVTPALGRELRSDEARGDSSLLVSHGFWTRKFGDDRGVIGRAIALREEPVTIIGVLPADFRFRRAV